MWKRQRITNENPSKERLYWSDIFFWIHPLLSSTPPPPFPPPPLHVWTTNKCTQIRYFRQKVSLRFVRHFLLWFLF